MTKEILLIQEYSKLVDKLQAENEVLRELLNQKQSNYVLVWNSRERYKTMYENLKSKLKGVCDGM